MVRQSDTVQQFLVADSSSRWSLPGKEVFWDRRRDRRRRRRILEAVVKVVKEVAEEVKEVVDDVAAAATRLI